MRCSHLQTARGADAVGYDPARGPTSGVGGRGATTAANGGGAMVCAGEVPPSATVGPSLLSLGFY
jgi:hypothetical protein